jgi:hypothetical protein
MTTSRATRLAELTADVTRIEQEMRALNNPTPSQLLDEQACAYQGRHGGTYAEAFAAVMEADPDLAKQYRVESFSVRTRKPETP